MKNLPRKRLRKLKKLSKWEKLSLMEILRNCWGISKLYVKFGEIAENFKQILRKFYDYFEENT